MLSEIGCFDTFESTCRVQVTRALARCSAALHGTERFNFSPKRIKRLRFYDEMRKFNIVRSFARLSASIVNDRQNRTNRFQKRGTAVRESCFLTARTFALAAEHRNFR